MTEELYSLKEKSLDERARLLKEVDTAKQQIEDLRETTETNKV